VARVLAWAVIVALNGGLIYGLVWVVRVTLRESKGNPRLRAGWLSALVVGVAFLAVLTYFFHAP
jgi:hypothetical protein